jgi:hypothetical protein
MGLEPRHDIKWSKRKLLRDDKWIRTGRKRVAH